MVQVNRELLIHLLEIIDWRLKPDDEWESEWGQTIGDITREADKLLEKT